MRACALKECMTYLKENETEKTGGYVVTRKKDRRAEKENNLSIDEYLIKVKSGYKPWVI